MRGLSRQIALAMKVASVAMVLAMVLPVAAASAMGRMTAGLSVDRVPTETCGNLVCAAGWVVTVHATVPLSPGEAALVTDHRIGVRLWGDDPSSDDLRVGPTYIANRKPTTIEPRCGRSGGSYFYSEPAALRIRWCRFDPSPDSNSYILDEDRSVFDNRDEVYAGVRLLSPHTGTVRLAETNRIYGYW